MAKAPKNPEDAKSAKADADAPKDAPAKDPKAEGAQDGEAEAGGGGGGGVGAIIANLKGSLAALKGISPKAVLGGLKSKLKAIKTQPLRGTRDLWPIPVLLLGAALIGLGGSMWVKTAPKDDWDGALKEVALLIDAGEAETALARLAEPLGQHILSGTATDEQQREFYLLSADALAIAQRQMGIDVVENHRSIVDYYKKARDGFIGAPPLEAQRQYNLAESLIRAGAPREGVQEALKIPDALREKRQALLRRIVEASLFETDPPLSQVQAMELLTKLHSDPTISEADRVWAFAQQARLRIEAGYHEAAISNLLVQVQELESRDTPEAGGLFLLLGRAYYELGQIQLASRHLDRAVAALPASDERSGFAEVLLAHIAQHKGEITEARDRFAGVSERFRSTSVAISADLGLAEVQAELAQYEDARRAYERVVLALNRGERSIDATPERVQTSIDQQFARLFLEGDYRNALRFAKLMERLSPAELVPPDVVLKIADTHAALARQLLDGVPRDVDGLPDFTNVDPVTREEARSHSYRGAIEYRRHARAMTLTDPEAAAESLWNAADGFDHAGEQQQAQQVFAEFVQTRPGDPRRVEAQYRLARAHQAHGDYGAATEIFEQIIRNNPTSNEAYRSYVPLAQCYLLSPGAPRIREAEAKLLAIVEGGVLGPEAPQFREAIVELGMMYRRSGRYPEAIARLKAATARYPDLAQDPATVSALADSIRGSADEIAEELQQPLPPSERQRLAELRVVRLREANAEYEAVHNIIEDIDPANRTQLQKQLLRNSMFYRGDCAFALGKHYAADQVRADQYMVEAIQYYDAAASRFPEHPGALVAMMQIVNAHAAMGNWREARTAHARAKARLDEMPDESFNSPESPMSRRHWEEWIESTLRLERMASNNGTSSP